MRFSSEPFRQQRPANSFGLRFADDSDYDDDEWDSDSVASDDSFVVARDDPSTVINSSPNSRRTAASIRELTDTLAAIRLRASYNDPYAQWERTTKQESLLAVMERTNVNANALQDAASRIARERIAQTKALQTADVQKYLDALAKQHKLEEERLTLAFKQRNKQLWDRVEATIKQEEDKARKIWEQEEAARQLEAKRKAEAEAKVKAEAEKKLKEEEEAKAREKVRAAMQAKKQEEEKRKQEQEKEELAKQAAAAAMRERLGQVSAIDEWRLGRKVLHEIKGELMPTVKLTDSLRVIYSAQRRKITAKIGQITNDESAIQGICTFLFNTMRPTPPHEDTIYAALLSGLAKAILMQAETEVSASNKTAVPLARVTALMLDALPGFADALWARLIQRAGGWAVPLSPPPLSDREDDSGRTLLEEEYRVACGFRGEESLAEYTSRVVGMLTLYFSILVTSTSLSGPLPPRFAFPHLWAYISRLMCSPSMLKHPIAPQALTAALEVGGSQAARMWGRQFRKLLLVMHKTLSDKSTEELIGGPNVEGRQGRTRVLLEVERLLQQ